MDDDFVFQVETMSGMCKRLSGCGAAPQAVAVKKAIELIDKAPGGLDMQNTATALYWLSVALIGKGVAAEALANASDLANHAI